jgi:hypothetical protein
MKKRVGNICLWTLLGALIVGCSGTSEPGGANDLSGTWTLEYQSAANPNILFMGSAPLSQSGSSVTGTLTCTQTTNGNGVCPATSEGVSGTVSGASVTMSVATECNGVAGAGSPIVLMGTIAGSGTPITGTYTQAANAACSGQGSADNGTWNATKVTAQ